MSSAVGEPGTIHAVSSRTMQPKPRLDVLPTLAYFFFGTLAGALFARGYRLDRLGPLTGLLALAVLGLVFWGRNLFPAPDNCWGLETAAVSTILVYLVAHDHPLSAAVLAAPPLKWMGRISFSLHLLHVPLIFLTQRLSADRLPPLESYLLGVALALTGAWLSDRLIEEPGCRLFGDLLGAGVHGFARADDPDCFDIVPHCAMKLGINSLAGIK